MLVLRMLVLLLLMPVRRFLHQSPSVFLAEPPELP